MTTNKLKSQWLEGIKIDFLLILHIHGRLVGTLIHLVFVLSWGLS